MAEKLEQRSRRPKPILSPRSFRRLVEPELITINAPAMTIDERRAQFRAYHRIGGLLNSRLPDKLPYGDNTIAELATIIGHKEGWVYKVRDFGRTFEQKSLNLLLEHADRIRWQHVLLMLSVEPNSERTGLLRKAANSRWTPVELGQAIQAQFGKRRKGGRPFAKPDPENPQAGLRQIIEFTESWLSRYENVWKAGYDSPAGALAKKIPPKTRRSVSRKLRTAQKALGELAKATREAIALISADARPKRAPPKRKADCKEREARAR